MLATKITCAIRQAENGNKALAKKLATLCEEETKLDASGQTLCAAGGRSLAEALQGNQVMTELNLAGNQMGKESAGMFGLSDMSGVVALAGVISGMGAMSSLNLAENMIRAEGAKHLSAAIKGHKSLTILDISSNEIGAYSSMADSGDDDGPWIASPEGPLAVADAVKDMGALKSLNISNNMLTRGALRKWVKSECFYKRDWGKAGGHYETDIQSVVILVDAIRGNGAMTKLDISKNNIMAEGGKALAVGLKGNQVMTELNISSNNLSNYGEDMSGVTAVANAISSMGVISMVIFSGDDYDMAKPITIDTSMVEADFGGKCLAVSGAIMIAAFLPKCT
jgi:Ran GTPase-activating protein (RanGAP) involved in mRNA processing and transport